MKEAVDYIRTAVKIDKNLDDLIEMIGMNNYCSGLKSDRQGYQDSLGLIKRILATPNLSRQQHGRVLQSRAAARWALGERAAIDDYHEAIRYLPDDPFSYEDRATYYTQTHQDDRAAADRRKAQELRAQKPGGQPR
jgi:hypothetical protein